MNTRLSVFYINDVHGQVPKMEHLKTASVAFDDYVRKQKTDSLKVGSGDIFIGKEQSKNRVGVEFMNKIGLDFLTLGNHEFDMPVSTLASIYKKLKAVILGSNINVPQTSPIKEKIQTSVVKEINGHKYGIIGIQPCDLKIRLTSTKNLEGIEQEDVQGTIKKIQEEVKKLEKQGVDKIFLLSHAGIVTDRQIAQQVEGLDVIFGAHTHDLIKGAKMGDNLFMSKRNEPVLITQAGRDGNNFGVLNLEFDDKGSIRTIQNSINSTLDFSKNIVMSMISNMEMGVPEQVGYLKQTPTVPGNLLTEENKLAGFYADAMREELNTDIAVINSGNLRGTLVKGPVTVRDIQCTTPHANRMSIINITEQELVDSVRYTGKALDDPTKKKGLLQFSGVEYTLSPKGDLKEMYFVDKKGFKTKIDVNHPSNRTYTLACDEFLSKGREGLSMFNKWDKPETQKFDFDKDKLVASFIKKKNNQPFEIMHASRINIE